MPLSLGSRVTIGGMIHSLRTTESDLRTKILGLQAVFMEDKDLEHRLDDIVIRVEALEEALRIIDKVEDRDSDGDADERNESDGDADERNESDATEF